MYNILLQYTDKYKEWQISVFLLHNFAPFKKKTLHNPPNTSSLSQSSLPFYHTHTHTHLTYPSRQAACSGCLHHSHHDNSGRTIHKNSHSGGEGGGTETKRKKERVRANGELMSMCSCANSGSMPFLCWNTFLCCLVPSPALSGKKKITK